MCRVLINEYYAPCPMSQALRTEPYEPCTKPYAIKTEPYEPYTMCYALRTEPLALCTMHACKSYLVLKISPKLASGYVPRYGPLIISCFVKGLQFDFRIIKRFIICFLNNELDDNDYYYRLCYIQFSYKECDY